MSDSDTRWVQRFQNFQLALARLTTAVGIAQPSEIERAGLIQFFEYTFELAWKTLKDYLEAEGFAPEDVRSPRAAIRQAFAQAVVADGAGWLRMLDDRNRTVHTYDEAAAAQVAHNVATAWLPLLTALHARLLPDVSRPTAPPPLPSPAAEPLPPAELAELRAVFGQVPGLTKVVLFGSRAKGTHRPTSDIDLALFGPLSPAALARAAGLLDASTLPYQVDVLAYDDIDSPDLRAHIGRVGVVVWKK